MDASVPVSGRRLVRAGGLLTSATARTAHAVAGLWVPALLGEGGSAGMSNWAASYSVERRDQTERTCEGELSW